MRTDSGAEGWYYFAKHAGPVFVERHPMDPDEPAYDKWGRYWGIGDPLWVVNGDGTDDDGDYAISYYTRAPDLDTAVGMVFARYPLATVTVE